MNVVSKATSRKRGAAKTVRAAQRTPLPGDQVTEQIDARAETTDNLGAMSLTELRQYAVAQGWSTATKESKAGLLRILRANPDGPPKSAKKAQPKPADDVESKPSASVDPKRCKEIAARMVAERKTYTRGVLAEAAGVTPSLIWRFEQGRPKPEELACIEGLFAKIDAGELTAPERKVFGQPQSGPTKTALKSTLDEVAHVLSEAPATGAKVAQLRAAINTALDIIERATKSDDDN